MQASAAFFCHCLQRRQWVKAFPGIDHGCAMGGASQIAQYHAEAMIKRYGNAKLILRRQLHRLTDEIAIIQNIVVGQRRTLGRDALGKPPLTASAPHKIETLTKVCQLFALTQIALLNATTQRSMH